MEDLFQKKKMLLEVLHTLYEKEHFHQEIELLYVLEGGLTVIQDGQESRMKAHDILIVNSEKRHSLKGTEDTLYLKLTLQYNLISDIVDALDIFFWCDSTRNSGDAYAGLEALLLKLLSRYLGNKGNAADFLHISLCYQILDYLCSHFMVRGSVVSEESDEERFSVRKRQISRYIQSNYGSQISLKDLSEKLFLSTGYLSRFFQKQFGMSFNKYLTKVRLHHAMDELLYTEAPITRIVYDNGFANVTVFNKTFREEYGDTPTALRKRLGEPNQKIAAPLTADTTRRLENILWSEREPSEASEEKMTLRVSHSAASYAPLVPIWNQVINIGTADDLFRSEIREHAVFLRKNLGIRSMRFWNPFSKAMLIDVKQTENYNFSRLDSVLDFLLENDITPFIELGNKPRRLERATHKPLIYEPTDSIDDIPQWTNLLRAFLRHEISRHGAAKVDSWKFELWMNFDDIFDEQKTDFFAQKFRATISVVRGLLKKAEIGGCGMLGHTRSADESAPRLDAFSRALTAAECYPDFISLYVYPYDAAFENGRLVSSMRNSDRYFVRGCVEEYRRAVSDEIKGSAKLYITEWNLTVSHRNWLNDSCFKAAYILRNYIDLIGAVDAMAYYLGSDRVSEHYDTRNCLFGGAGLLSKDGILKPAGVAFAFLNRLYPNMIGKGENYILTTDGRGSFALLCHNMRDLGHNYYLEQEDALDPEHLSKYFEDMKLLNMDLVLYDVEDGTYRLRIRKVNEKSGSMLHYWRELNYEPELSQSDIQYLHRICNPNLSIQSVTSENRTLHLEYTMQPNEIALLQLFRSD